MIPTFLILHESATRAEGCQTSATSRLTEDFNVTCQNDSPHIEFLTRNIKTAQNRHFSKRWTELWSGTQVENDVSAAQRLSSLTDSPHGVRAAKSLGSRLSTAFMISFNRISPSTATRKENRSCHLPNHSRREAELLPAFSPTLELSREPQEKSRPQIQKRLAGE